MSSLPDSRGKKRKFPRQPRTISQLAFQTPVPKFLFRAYSDQSHGVNTERLIGPQKPAGDNHIEKYRLRYNPALGPIGRQLRKSVWRKDNDENCFVFWSSSLLCVVLHALQKSNPKKQKKKGSKVQIAKQETNVQIVCIPTSAVKTKDGRPVHFLCVEDVRLLELGKLTTQYGEDVEVDCADIWVTTDSVSLPDEARRASLAELEAAGIGELFPEFAIIPERSAGFVSPLMDMRTVWNPQQRDLASTRIAIAARLATKFKLLSGNEDMEMPNHLFAWFLALKSQDPNGVNLTTWLNNPSTTTDELKYDTVPTMHEAGIDLIEFDRWEALYARLENARIPASRVANALPTQAFNDRCSITTMAEANAFRQATKKRVAETRRKRADYDLKHPEIKEARDLKRAELLRKRKAKLGEDDVEHKDSDRIGVELESQTQDDAEQAVTDVVEDGGIRKKLKLMSDAEVNEAAGFRENARQTASFVLRIC